MTHLHLPDGFVARAGAGKGSVGSGWAFSINAKADCGSLFASKA
jgi:hypothetical protein